MVDRSKSCGGDNEQNNLNTNRQHKPLTEGHHELASTLCTGQKCFPYLYFKKHNICGTAWWCNISSPAYAQVCGYNFLVPHTAQAALILRVSFLSHKTMSTNCRIMVCAIGKTTLMQRFPVFASLQLFTFFLWPFPDRYHIICRTRPSLYPWSLDHAGISPSFLVTQCME